MVGQWSMVLGQWAMVGQWSVVLGQWAMAGQWSMVLGQWSMVLGQWAMDLDPASVRNFVCGPVDHGHSRCGEAAFIENRKLIHRGSPEPRPAFPFCRDIADGEPDQFGRRLIIRKMASGLDDFPQLRVDALERISG